MLNTIKKLISKTINLLKTGINDIVAENRSYIAPIGTDGKRVRPFQTNH